MENNNNTQSTFTCSGDCMGCSFQQRVYCSAQISRNNLDILEDIRQRLDRMEKSNSEQDALFNPMNAEKTEEPTVVENDTNV